MSLERQKECIRTFEEVTCCNYDWMMDINYGNYLSVKNLLMFSQMEANIMARHNFFFVLYRSLTHDDGLELRFYDKSLMNDK